MNYLWSHLCNRGMWSFCGELYRFADGAKCRFSLRREYRGRIQSEKWISNLVRAWSICCMAQFRSRFTFWCETCTYKDIVIWTFIFILRSILCEYKKKYEILFKREWCISTGYFKIPTYLYLVIKPLNHDLDIKPRH